MKFFDMVCVWVVEWSRCIKIAEQKESSTRTVVTGKYKNGITT